MRFDPIHDIGKTMTMMEIQVLLETYHLTQAAFSSRFGIPLRTVENWCEGVSTPPKYVVDLIRFRLEHENGH